MEHIQDSLFGKMYREPSAPTREKISGLCWKSLPTFGNRELLFLNLADDGQRPGLYGGAAGALHGGCLMLNIGECPNEEKESHLSWILQDNVPEKYYLSAQACKGILNRASRRGKVLPEILKTALENMIVWWENTPPATLKIRSGCEGGGKGALIQTDKSATLSTLQDQTLFQPVACLLNDQGGSVINVEDGSVSPTLRAEAHNHEPNVVMCMGTGQANAEVTENVSPCLNCNHEQTIVFDARGNGDGKTVPTITGDHENRVTDYTAVCVQNTGQGWWNQTDVGATVRTHCGGDSTKANLVCIGTDIYNGKVTGDCACSLTTATGRGYANTGPSVMQKAVRWIVRRLTPTECGRLQGYPDGWCDIGDWTDSKGKKHKDADTPKYKAYGNSIALPQWWWLIRKMAIFLPDDAKLGSLFDGIGGFPLVWEECHGKGTARWASEIEEFPIAVTKYHFPE